MNASTLDMNTGPDSDSNRDPARNIIACSNCRSQKIKCFPSPVPDEPCKRCARYSLTCEYLQHKRGRKKKDQTGNSANKPVQNPDFTGQANGHKHSSPSPERNNPAKQVFDSRSAGRSISTPSRHHLTHHTDVSSTRSSLQASNTTSSSLPPFNPVPSNPANTFRREPLMAEPIRYLQTRPQPDTGMVPSIRSTQEMSMNFSDPIQPGYQLQPSYRLPDNSNVLSNYNTPIGQPIMDGPAYNAAPWSEPVQQLNMDGSSSTRGLRVPVMDPNRFNQDAQPTYPQMQPYGTGAADNMLPVLPPPNISTSTSGTVNRIRPLLPTDIPVQNRMCPARASLGAGEFAIGSSLKSSGFAPTQSPTPISGYSAKASDATSGESQRRGRSPVLSSNNSKFPFLNANAGFRSMDTGGHYTTNSGRNSPVHPTEDIARDPLRQLPPLDEISSSSSARRRGAREKFSLRDMVEPVDEEPSEMRARKSSAEAMISGPDMHGDRAYNLNHGVTPSRKRKRMSDRGSLAGSPELDIAELRQDPVTMGIVDEKQARDLFNIYLNDINASAGILDRDIHTFEWIRSNSSFLFTAVLCVTARFYRGGLESRIDMQQPIPRSAAKAVHHRCLMLAREQMGVSCKNGISTLETIQAITLLAIWKEADDDKAAHHFNRAVMMAREIRLNAVNSRNALSPEEKKWRRAKRRIWLCMFIVTTVFAMQFNSPLLITQEDLMVAQSQDFYRDSNDPSLDLAITASVQLRIKFLHYKSILDITAVDESDEARPVASFASTLVSLSIITRTMNQDMRVTNDYWVTRLQELTKQKPTKPHVWLNGLLLNLNLTISNQIIRIQSLLPPDMRTGIQSAPSHHHSLSVACDLLIKTKDLSPRILSYASDTLLHFTIYAAYFLYTVCAPSSPSPLEKAERQQCYDIIFGAADALIKASIFSADAPSLHARFLKRLVSTSQNAWFKEEGGVQEPKLKQETDPLGQSQITQPPELADGILPMAGQDAYIPQIYPNPQDNTFIAPPVVYPGITGADDSLWMQLDTAWWDHVLHDTTSLANGNGNRMSFQQAY